MDQARAKTLLAEGAFLIFLNVPEGTEFGIDLKSWNTGDKFRGVKMIPPGVHFIFYSSVSSTEDTAPRTGFFHNFKKGEVLVKKWDKRTEQISVGEVPEREILGLKENILNLDEFLGPYPYDILDKWRSLSRYISEDVIKALTPEVGVINSALQLQSCPDKDRPRGTAILSTALFKKQRLSSNPEDLLPDLKPIEGTALKVTQFPERNYPEGCSPAEITQHSLDLTSVFQTILATYASEKDILGELQFCYISFLVGHSFEAFDQWKKLFTLFCSCEAAISKYRFLYDSFITLIEPHVKEVPEAFLADIVSNNNFVYLNLKKFFKTVRNVSIDGQLKAKIERLKVELESDLLWDFDQLNSEDEEEAPVVVQL